MSLAENIAHDLMRKLKSGEIKKIDINDIRAACKAEGRADLADVVCRRMVEMVG